MSLACGAGCEGDRQVRCEHREGSGAVHQRPAGADSDQGELCRPGGHHRHQGHLPALPQSVSSLSAHSPLTLMFPFKPPFPIHGQT